jgi:dienelactone hydrolase
MLDKRDVRHHLRKMRAAPTCIALAVAAATVACAAQAVAEPAWKTVTFHSLDGKTQLTAALGRPSVEAARPALVLLHGCTGLRRQSGRMFPIYRAWSNLLAQAGYVLLVVDSAGSRGVGQTCTASAERRRMLAERPKDAYAALRYLQAQDRVRSDRIGVVGWSQGGATVLLSIAAKSSARPPGLAHDFRAAVAFYPGRCSDRQQARPFVDADPGTWTTTVPLLVLFGEADNWAPAAPCAELIAAAKTRGAPVEIKLYPGADHVFDAPNLKRRELPELRMRDGTVPITGTDPAARADALVRAPEFLRRHLGE